MNRIHLWAKEAREMFLEIKGPISPSFDAGIEALTGRPQLLVGLDYRSGCEVRHRS